jgi:hypothetical protein
MNLIVPIICIPLSISEINKSFLVLRKNQKHIFLAFRVLLLMITPFLPAKRLIEINKEYYKKIETYAIQSLWFWIFVLIYNIIRLIVAIVMKELF